MATGFLRPRGTPPFSSRAQAGLKVTKVPAPSGGVNAVDALSDLPPQFCIQDFNMIPDGRGMRVRSGYREFATNVGTGGIRTVIPFTGSVTANNRLFAAASGGIYDVTTGGAGPWTAEATFPTISAQSGYGIWSNFIADSGTYYALYADEANGLYRRIESGTWAAVTDITGVSELELSFVTTHKTRLWFVQRGTATAWYLASGAIAGPATPFYFGNKFKYGGTLVGVYTWSQDGGDGIDDYLVAVGSGGDVIVYRGSDPSSTATWEHVGTYYLGGLPTGRRIAASFGGDLYLLSQYGVLPLTRLVSGRPVQETASLVSKNISPLISDDMVQKRTQVGWELRNIPSENVFALVTPPTSGTPPQYTQYALSSQTNGWCVFASLPYTTGDTFLGTFYFGNATDTTLFYLTENSDGVLLDGTGGAQIAWSLLTSFQEYGEDGRYHRVQFMRPVFITDAVPAYAIQARYDYDEAAITGSATPPAISTSLWDTALWDSGIWGGTTVIESVVAGTGIGRAMAIGLRGSSSAATLLVRFDIMFDSGGPL